MEQVCANDPDIILETTLDILVSRTAIERSGLRQTTKFTCCARCGAVAPRVLGLGGMKCVDARQTGRLFGRAQRSRLDTSMVLEMRLN